MICGQFDDTVVNSDRAFDSDLNGRSGYGCVRMHVCL